MTRPRDMNKVYLFTYFIALSKIVFSFSKFHTYRLSRNFMAKRKPPTLGTILG